MGALTSTQVGQLDLGARDAQGEASQRLGYAEECESLERLLKDASSHASRTSDSHAEFARLDHDVHVRARRLEYEALVHAGRTVVLELN
jgi:hypothetical protein